MNKHAVPTFAMSFTQEAVFLERREGQDWQPLGHAEFARGNLTGQLSALRGNLARDSSDPDTVLVIPDDQILYTRITASPGADIPAAIARALEGMTPYKSDDLVYDWCPDSDGSIDSLRVAAVSRKTLQEAEEFSRLQGFRPTGFMARPDDDRFEGDPDFGESELVRKEHDSIPFSKPDLRNAGITADRIDINEPEQSGPVISAIIPHYIQPQAKSTVPEDAPPILPEPDHLATEPEARPEPVGEPGPDVQAPKTHVPVAASVVIRHGDVHVKPIATGLSSRAKAFHERAAEARERRSESEDEKGHESVALLQRLSSYTPGNLAMLCGLLVVILVAALWIFGGGSDPAEIAETPAQTEQTDPSDLAAAGPQDSPSLSDMTAEDPDQIAPKGATAPDGTDTNNNSASVDPALPEVNEVPSQTPSDVVDAPAPASDDPLTAALAEAMRDTPVADALRTGEEDAQAGNQAAAETPSAEGSGARVLQGEAAQVAAGQAVARAIAPETSTETASQPEATAPQPQTAATRTQQALQTSSRPPRGTPAQSPQPARSDSLPSVPQNPQPFEQRTEPDPVRVSNERPPSRPAATPAPVSTPATAAPAPVPEAQPVTPAPSNADGANASPRPPSRPSDLSFLEEGDRSDEREPIRLAQSERQFLEQFLRDRRTAQAGAAPFTQAEKGAVIRLAQLRPQRRPVDVSGPSEDAVRDAVGEAISSSERPATRSDTQNSEGSSASLPPSRGEATASVSRSGRPMARPGNRQVKAGNDPGAGNPSLSRAAVENAIAAAVENSSASPGAVALTALTSSDIPPRRSGAVTAAAAAPSTAAPPSAPAQLDAPAAAPTQDAAIAEQRRLDESLQAQAEARARQRASADAQAEAQARAAAEARARAQAEAEARAAAARNQRYVPPEAENEPEVAQPATGGKTAPTVAAAATVKNGIQIKRTQIIGTIGAGKASRALVRLSNGKIITLRLGDKINGGQIVAIGDSRITYVEGGRSKQLSVLGGQ